MKEILLSKTSKLNRGKYVAIIDDNDYDYLNSFNWSVLKHRKTFYAIRNAYLNGKHITIMMHAEIMGKKGCDHIDRNGLNNQRSNLRFSTNSQNLMNQIPQENKSSIYKGVCWDKHCKKWASAIMLNYKHIHLGRFDNEIEAAITYDNKAKELFGEFAYLNFPKKINSET